MVEVVIAIFAIMALATLRRPFYGAALIWFAIWLYPNTAMHGLLPMDIRLDDLFVVFVFIVAMVYARGNVPSTIMVKLALAWMAVQVIGNAAGFVLAGNQDILGILKFTLKAAYVPMTAAVLAATIKTDKDVNAYLKWLCVAGVAAALLGICTVYYPRRFEMFLIRDVDPMLGSVLDRLEGKTLMVRRAAGAIGIIATSLVMMNMSLLTLSRWLFTKENFSARIVFYASAFALCAAGLVYSQTRGAMLAFAAAVLWGLLRSKDMRFQTALKAVSATSIGALALAVASYKHVNISQLISGRFSGGAGTSLAGGLASRTGVWQYLTSRFDPAYLLTGIGMISAQEIYTAQNFGTAHNAYLGAFIYTGVLGFAVLVLIVVHAWKLSSRLLSKRDNLTVAMMGTYLSMLTVAMLVAGVTIENFQQTVCMQLFFAGAFLAERTLLNVEAAEKAEAAQVSGVSKAGKALSRLNPQGMPMPRLLRSDVSRRGTRK